jgi:hypothetical protein
MTNEPRSVTTPAIPNEASKPKVTELLTMVLTEVVTVEIISPTPLRTSLLQADVFVNGSFGSLFEVHSDIRGLFRYQLMH